MLVGQPPFEIAENQPLFAYVNLASFEKLKEKVVSTQHTMDVEIPQSEMGIEAKQEFEVSVNLIPIDNLIRKPVSAQSNRWPGIELVV